jgi:hypothetical protein
MGRNQNTAEPPIDLLIVSFWVRFSASLSTDFRELIAVAFLPGFGASHHPNRVSELDLLCREDDATEVCLTTQKPRIVSWKLLLQGVSEFVRFCVGSGGVGLPLSYQLIHACCHAIFG